MLSHACVSGHFWFTCWINHPSLGRHSAGKIYLTDKLFLDPWAIEAVKLSNQPTTEISKKWVALYGQGYTWCVNKPPFPGKKAAKMSVLSTLNKWSSSRSTEMIDSILFLVFVKTAMKIIFMEQTYVCPINLWFLSGLEKYYLWESYTFFQISSKTVSESKVYQEII